MHIFNFSYLQSEDCGSETSSGIFNRFLRRDSNMPLKGTNGVTKKYSKTNKVNPPDDQISESRKPLIAKWKQGAKLQVTGRHSESDGKSEKDFQFCIFFIEETMNLF